jgi:hypothetical protein
MLGFSQQKPAKCARVTVSSYSSNMLDSSSFKSLIGASVVGIDEAVPLERVESAGE